MVRIKPLRGSSALITGASGGIGKEIARTLARNGVDLVISGRNEEALKALAAEIEPLSVRCQIVAADLADRDSLGTLIERAQQALRPIDVLVNNAGIENIAAFAAATQAELANTVEVNLIAPLLLTSLAVPGMLQRGKGHVVFVSSVAGLAGVAYDQPYSASKAGLVALTQALRAEYHDRPVGFSVVCPGFTRGEGMYQRMADEGHRPSRLIGETSTAKVAEAVRAAIVDDLPLVVESGAPIRPALAMQLLAPRFAEKIAPRFGATKLFRAVAVARGRAQRS